MVVTGSKQIVVARKGTADGKTLMFSFSADNQDTHSPKWAFMSNIVLLPRALTLDAAFPNLFYLMNEDP